MKIVINKCYGGFGLSDQAFERLIELGMTVTKYDKDGKYEDDSADIVDSSGKYSSLLGKYSFTRFLDWQIRTDLRVIQVVSELGAAANGSHAELSTIEIPDGVEWQIEEYDGIEWIAEKHRTWR